MSYWETDIRREYLRTRRLEYLDVKSRKSKRTQEKELNDLYSSPNIIRSMIWGRHLVRTGKNRNAWRGLVGSPLRRFRSRCRMILKCILKNWGFRYRWNLVQDGVTLRNITNTINSIRVSWKLTNTLARRALLFSVPGSCSTKLVNVSLLCPHDY